jgi:hypothetical protein
MNYVVICGLDAQEYGLTVFGLFASVASAQEWIRDSHCDGNGTDAQCDSGVRPSDHEVISVVKVRSAG